MSMGKLFLIFETAFSIPDSHLNVVYLRKKQKPNMKSSNFGIISRCSAP
jgi:hypothetical protein